ncbi:Hypothetical predicted protein [Paramuricea clavata]|uniref:Uncharacterized protein n=1 Tax=Paramuricea clavata TaxID=317549 RepID=A0A7D9E637_PARCT|nr:Hypothetical predicted protein [Paramuricea clavata]
MSSLRVYKRERTVIEKILGEYENGKTKIVTLKQWTKKCGLHVGRVNSAKDTFIYDSGIDISFDDMEQLADALPTMSKASQAVNYAELSESKDSYGNQYRLVLKSSEYGGLKVCKFKKAPSPVEFGTDDTDVLDPAPVTVAAKIPQPAKDPEEG